jgi:peroxiredoxin
MTAKERGHGPNLVIHFADEGSSTRLDELTRAVHESRRSDAATAVLVVGNSAQLSRLPFSESLTYAEDDGSLRRRYGIKSAGAATVVVSPNGTVAWKSEGFGDRAELASVLGKVLVKGAESKATMLTAKVRVGQPPPNFLFDHAPGQPLTLRKAMGRRVTIVFFRRSSQPSVEAVRNAVASAASRSIVLAVSPDAESGRDDLSPAMGVHDPAGRIASAYGVTMWPTIVTIDESGIVRSIDYGLLPRGDKSRA